jgi:hypothetical protein
MKIAMRVFVFTAMLVLGTCANAAQGFAGPGPWPEPPGALNR